VLDVVVAATVVVVVVGGSKGSRGIQPLMTRQIASPAAVVVARRTPSVWFTEL